MTQTELARRAKIGRISLVRIEQGRQDPTVGTVERIAKALGVKPRRLFP